MTVRPANFADIPGIIALLQEGHRRSHYALGPCQIDEKEAKRLLVNAMQRHGSHNLGGTWVMVAVKGERIAGFLLGTLSRVGVIGDRLFASDLFWYAAEDVDPTDPVRLMKSMIAWAEANPACLEVKCGTQAVVGDPKTAGILLTRLGLESYGAIFRKEFSR